MTDDIQIITTVHCPTDWFCVFTADGMWRVQVWPGNGVERVEPQPQRVLEELAKR
jgi:hypothetical protein